MKGKAPKEPKEPKALKRKSVKAKKTLKKPKTTKQTLKDVSSAISKSTTSDLDIVINGFYILENPLTQYILKYDKNQAFGEFQKLGHISGGYPYQEMNEYYDRLRAAYLVKNKILSDMNITEAPLSVKRAYSDFTRNITGYLVKQFAIHPKPSNAFTKIWEIYTKFPFLIPKSTKNINIFHICEAPGQMILATKRFISKKRRNIVNHEWFANSLNPYNPSNLEEYGSVFMDEYGIIKSNFKRWIWGADNTGDITKSANVRWYRKFISERMLPCNLIVGDGGLSTFTIEPIVLQKLDLAQAIMVVACSALGGNCVVKHFIPYIKRHEQTYGASGFFISFIYLYYLAFDELSLFKPYTSNPDSGEFYVVGRNFQGIPDKALDKLLEILDKFELSDALFPKDAIPDTFRIQIAKFIDDITRYNASTIEKQNMLLTCVKDKHDKILQDKFKCDSFLKPENLNEIQEPRFKKWIKMMEFE